MMGACIAAELAVLVSGDLGYLELVRKPTERLLDMGRIDENGHLVWPKRMTEEGWSEFETPGIRELSHLYHASMSRQDDDLIAHIRDHDGVNDWTEVKPEPDRRSGNSERPRFQFYDGQNPDWPTAILAADYEYALGHLEFMRSDPRDAMQIARDSKWPPNPCIVKGLTQTTLGSPQIIYNGGMLRATVRYFDRDRSRPGLPRDVAALVDRLGPDGVGVHLVNLSRTETRSLIVQSGAFNEHTFTDVSVRGAEASPTTVSGRHFAVTLTPSTSVRIDAGLQRFANKPTYAFPWHEDEVPVI